MSNGWHYEEGGKTIGPLDLRGLETILSRAPDNRSVLVWKPGFREWKLAGDVEELTALISTPPPLPTAASARAKPVEDLQLDPAPEMETRGVKKHKWRYARNGVIIGIIIVLADLLLEWRGRLYYPWISPEMIVSNITQMLAVIGIPALVGLVLGALRDRDRRRTRES
jgi:GYF domain 2